MDRRAVLASAAGVVATAGCSGLTGGGGGPSPPPRRRSAADVLPNAPEGWVLGARRGVGEGVGAEDGYASGYIPEDVEAEGRYVIAVYKFASESRVDELAGDIEERGEFFDATYVVPRGRFLVAGNHADGSKETLRSLMGEAESLTASYVQSNSLL